MAFWSRASQDFCLRVVGVRAVGRDGGVRGPALAPGLGLMEAEDGVGDTEPPPVPQGRYSWGGGPRLAGLAPPTAPPDPPVLLELPEPPEPFPLPGGMAVPVVGPPPGGPPAAVPPWHGEVAGGIGIMDRPRACV